MTKSKLKTQTARPADRRNFTELAAWADKRFGADRRWKDLHLADPICGRQAGHFRFGAGNHLAVEALRVGLARELIRRRWLVGLSQAEVAGRAGIRPETLNRIEKATVTADTGTITEVVKVLEKVDAADKSLLGSPSRRLTTSVACRIFNMKFKFNCGASDMKHVTLVEFRKSAEAILNRIQRGERFVLTRRGRPVIRLEPITESTPTEEDPIYRLAELALDCSDPMTNRDMDRAIYGV